MTSFSSFVLAPDEHGSVRWLLGRDEPLGVQGLEAEFFAAAGDFRRHEGSFADALAEVLRDETVGRVVVSRNPRLVLDGELAGRWRKVSERLDQVADRWALATCGGLSLDGRRVCSAYSSIEPSLPLGLEPAPIYCGLTDYYVLDGDVARAFLNGHPALWDEGLELGLVVHGYASGKVSLYLPELACSINGPFAASALLDHDGADRVLSALQVHGRWLTFAGPVEVDMKTVLASGARSSTRLDGRVRVHPARIRSAEAIVETAIEPMLAPLSLSVVTRTRFDRPHLLRRLLASVTRARLQDARLEVVLATDRREEDARLQLAALQSSFPDLTIRLVVSPRGRHSRIDNLLAGILAAEEEQVWIMDDDDFVDVNAFERLRRLRFLGSTPLAFVGSRPVYETWDLSCPGRPVLSASTPATEYPASGWRRMFAGVNTVPICGAVIPAPLLKAEVKRFSFRFDLSEDYTLYLLLLSAVDLPDIVEVPQTLAFISIRESEGHSVTLTDRTQWTRDIHGFISDLMEHRGGRAPLLWMLGASEKVMTRTGELEAVQAELARTRAQLTALRRENGHLRRLASEAAS